MHLDWQIVHYTELSINEFHDIVALRLKAFVVEQNCAYLDLDGKDKKSYHVICRDGKGDIVATARILPPGLKYKEASIGRVVINEEIRGHGVGQELMNKALDFSQLEFGASPVKISAQKHLETYYEIFGFKSTGEEYIEDTIPHVEMEKTF